MAVYQYEAMSATGEEIKDLINAEDEKEAQALVRRKGLFVTKIAEKRDRAIEDEPVVGHLFRFKAGLKDSGVEIDIGVFWILTGMVIASWLLYIFLSG